MTFVKRAKKFAHDAHGFIGQTRKYGNSDPYWVHTDEVARIVALFSLIPTTVKATEEQYKRDEIIAAAHLHDVVEDVNVEPYTIIDIALQFGGPVAKMVRELTDVYTSERYPDWNRKQRKEYEAIRLGLISEPARLIKLADLFSNTWSIVWHDRGFARTYLKEKEQILKHMKPLSMRTKILTMIVKAQLWLAKLYLKIADKTVDRKVKKK